jgi:hypothetical protein
LVNFDQVSVNVGVLRDVVPRGKCRVARFATIPHAVAVPRAARNASTH